MCSAQVTYTPSGSFVGSASFTYRTNDGVGAPNSQSNPATVSITVVQKGDVHRDGSVNVLDVIKINKHLLGITVLNASDTLAADVSPSKGQPGALPGTCGNNTLNNLDVEALLNAIVSGQPTVSVIDQNC
jgi:hypothetical protein